MTYEDARWVAKHLGRSEAALFSPAEVEALAPMLQDCSFNPGEVLFDRGSVPDGVWIIKNGWVELLAGATPAAGVIELLGPLQCFGEIPLMLEEPAPYTAKAVTEGSCLFMAAPDFARVIAGNPKFLLRWAGKLAGRVARVQGRIVEMLGSSLREQVARLLLHESRDGVFAFSQDTCAAMLGASRAPVNQVLKEFERLGVVAIGYGQVEILDEPGVARLTGDSPLEPEPSRQAGGPWDALRTRQLLRSRGRRGSS